MASELKPCPFCGATAKLHKYYGGTAFTVACDSLHRINTFETEAEAVATWNTRPAPAATDTGLVTVETQLKTDAGLWVRYRPETMLRQAGGNKIRELCDRSQAEEILAAERAEKEKLEAAWLEAEGVISDLKADNAAQAARIEFLERVLKKAESHTEALEAKLAAAEKALEPFAKIPVSTVPEGRLGHVPDKHPYMVDLDGNVLFTASDIREARAVLGGKPS